MLKKDSHFVDKTIQARKSIRAFEHTPVPEDLIRKILEVASRAPSGCNFQPWRVYVLTGTTLQRIVDVVCHAFDHEPGQHTSEFQHVLNQQFDPYLSRRRKMGIAMYGLAGVPKGDKERTRLQQRRNFEFFDAPVGLLFTVHRNLPASSLIGYGAFLQNVMTSAQGHGLGSCFQTAWCDYHRVISTELEFGAEEMLIGGMALGYPDADAPVNQLHTEREPVSEFATFYFPAQATF